MASTFAAVFATLKPVLGRYAQQLHVAKDEPEEYLLVTKSPSPYKQHKGQPLQFGSFPFGKAYVSFRLMPLYMCPVLTKEVSPSLKKRMQGKTCFNFRKEPELEAIVDLDRLPKAALRKWAADKLL